MHVKDSIEIYDPYYFSICSLSCQLWCHFCLSHIGVLNVLDRQKSGMNKTPQKPNLVFKMGRVAYKQYLHLKFMFYDL